MLRYRHKTQSNLKSGGQLFSSINNLSNSFLSPGEMWLYSHRRKVEKVPPTGGCGGTTTGEHWLTCLGEEQAADRPLRGGCICGGRRGVRFMVFDLILC